MDTYFRAALRLHDYLVAHHGRDDALVGPDPGVRFNDRLYRFAKSALRAVPWQDDLYYLQGQGYWVLANWRLAALTGDPDSKYRELAERCSATMLDRQRPDGTWEYPNPEWKDRVATAEGVWASLGLLESYRQTGDGHYLDGVMKWYTFMTETIGDQHIGDDLAGNYFAYRKGARVPNNTAFVLRFLAELADVTGDTSYLDRCAGLINFMRAVQKPSGEFPYAVEGEDGGAYKGHFQCYQYN